MPKHCAPVRYPVEGEMGIGGTGEESKDNVLDSF